MSVDPVIPADTETSQGLPQGKIYSPEVRPLTF